MSTDMIESRTKDASGVMSVATTRQASEVQAAMIVAKQYPRDETAAISRIIQSCKRKGLAEVAIYAYPKGSTKVTGSSIRLAEAMAQAWGNIDYGLIELEQKFGESSVMAYCWDLETNVRRQMVFTVKHIRSTKQGNVTLSDPRDIYEMVANQGARRVRACILGVIPGDVEDLALDECEKTLRSGGVGPLSDRVRKMVAEFVEFGVSREMIEARLQHKVEACIEQDVLGLKKIYISMRDGMSKRDDWFSVTPTEDKQTSRVEQVKRATSQKPDVKEEPEVTPEPEAVEATGEPVASLVDSIVSIRKAMLAAEPDGEKRKAIYAVVGIKHPGVDREFTQKLIDDLWSIINEGNRE